ncbi:hypothetical protein [Burkholderia diffusa]|uniref:hypothetical protein n=1 Tax=Burkholderia diffusa TaxID=488732 RepID=UPI0012DB6D19|nr:hypothetical protein [Burkholderia diffusa]
MLDFIENDARPLRARMHVRIVAANEGRARVAFVRGPDGAEIDEEDVVAGAYLIGDRERLARAQRVFPEADDGRMPDALHPEFLEHARPQRIGLRLRIPGSIQAAIASTACHVMVLACRIASSESASPAAPAASNSKWCSRTGRCGSVQSISASISIADYIASHADV